MMRELPFTPQTLTLAFRHDVGRDLRYLIARVTGSPVHVALLFDHVCIEADTGGVRQLSRQARLWSGTWTLVPVPHVNVELAYAFARSCVGEPYDYLGALWGWWGGRAAGAGRAKKWYCSELAAATLRAGGQVLPIARAAAYHPRKLYDTVAPWR